VALETKDDMTLWDGSKGSGTELAIQAAAGSVVLDPESAYLGCSIAVNGVCLTATKLDFERNTFRVGLAPETLRRTYFGDPTQFYVGQRVNLERASEIGARNSGHFVQGHIDGTGAIVDKWKDDDSLFYKIELAEDLMQYVVPKGFVAVDGTSLTVVDVNVPERWFTFMLVAYTQQKIVVPYKEIGDKVNIEVDVLGKYSETAMSALIPRIEALEARVETLERQLLLKGEQKESV